MELIQGMVQEHVQYFIFTFLGFFFLLIGFIIFVFLFKAQLAERIHSISGVEIDRRNRKFKIEFAKRVKKAGSEAKAIERKVTAAGYPAAPRMELDFKTQRGRDGVLEIWGALKQVLYDACAARDIRLMAGAGIPEAVRRLGEADLVGSELVDQIIVLDELGRALAEDASLRPLEEDALTYRDLADTIRSWIMLSIFPPREAAESGKPFKAPMRHTLVGQTYSQPGSGESAAVLVGVGGAVAGRRLPIDKDSCRIGRNSENDLCIAGDDAVSGIHALLRYEGGNLFLSDLDSLNGTFLNENRVTGTPLMVRPGDHIRIGSSIFEVSVKPVGE